MKQILQSQLMSHHKVHKLSFAVKRRRNFRGQDALNLEREFMMQ